MITVYLNQANFEYDIHSLVKAFYPQHDVSVKAAEPDAFAEGEEAIFHISVEYLDTCEETDAFDGKPGSIRFAFYQNMRDEYPVLIGETAVDFADRKETKNRLKQKLYCMLEEFSGQKLPWGTLTGIRPTKIPMAMLEEGKTEPEIRSYMKETYFASDEKIDLAIGVAERELKLLEQIDYENGYSLYIGIPFCPSTCLYCSFTSYPLTKWEKRVDEYLDALEKEIDFVAESCRSKYLNSIYIGGGTPTTLNPQQLERLLTKIGESFDLFDEEKKFVYLDPDGTSAGKQTHLLEFTIEGGRPDSITREKLEVLRAHGISRISINPQTMKEETLRLIGRRHTVEQTKESFRLARELGFDNINMDLIVGLPEESIEDVRNTMEELCKLDPDNVTVHSLAIKRAARLRMEKEQYAHLHMENTWETIQVTADYCQKMGMDPYYLYRQKNMAGNFENVGYAKPGKAGVYNILIMEEKQTIMALGAGATTKFVLDGGTRIERVENVKDITNYLDRTDEMIERKRKRMEELQWL